MSRPDGSGTQRSGVGRTPWWRAALVAVWAPVRAVRRFRRARRGHSPVPFAGARRRHGRRPVRPLPLIARFLVLGASAYAALRFPALWFVAAAVWVWVVWSLAARPRDHALGADGAPPPRRRSGLRVRYLGGHPALPRPGRGVVMCWPEDGAAELRVGRQWVAFPIAAIQAVTLVEGRVMLHTGCRGHMAAALGRLMASGMGKYCGLRHHRHEDLAIIDRSRVLCDLHRQGHPCRLILAGPRGGGEDVYLELLVMLRPLRSWRQPGAAGGAMGAASSPPQAG